MIDSYFMWFDSLLFVWFIYFFTNYIEKKRMYMYITYIHIYMNPYYSKNNAYLEKNLFGIFIGIVFDNRYF